MLAIIDIPRPRTWQPRVSAFTRPFWDGLARGRLLTTRCTACGRLYVGTAVHAAPMEFRDEAPHRVGIVDLEEGLRLATRLLGEAAIPLDTAVELVALRYTDGPLFAARAA